MTIDPGARHGPLPGHRRARGEAAGEAALSYFHQSEQLPTFIRLAVARHYAAAENGAPGQWRWRAGGLMIQHLARAAARSAGDDQIDDDELTRRRGRRLGRARASWRRPSRITSCSIRCWRPSGCSTACSTRRACVRFPAAPIAAVLPLLARARRGVSAQLRRRGAHRHARARRLDQRHLRVLHQDISLRARRDRVAAPTSAFSDS